MKKLCVALSLMMGMSAAQADIYKWVDGDGNVHFGDTPHPGAERLNIPEAQSTSSSTPGQTTSPDKSATNGAEGEQKENYTTVEIAQPENEATIRNNQGYVAVSVHLEPDLFPGHKLQLVFDGGLIGEPQINLNFQLSNVYRGSHTLAVQVLNAEGEVIQTSDPVTIYVFRPRVGMGAPAPRKRP